VKIPQWVYTLLPMFKPEKINIGGTSMTVLPGDDRSKSISSAPELGDRVRDPITGFTGIVVVTANFLNGCVRCGVAPETLKDGLPQREEHFDQAQLEVVDKTVFVPAGRTAKSRHNAHCRRPWKCKRVWVRAQAENLSSG